MFKRTGKLYTRNLVFALAYDFVNNIIALVNTKLSGNTVVEPYVNAAQSAVEDLDRVLSRKQKHPLTVTINQKHEERKNLLTALRQQIGVA